MPCSKCASMLICPAQTLSIELLAAEPAMELLARESCETGLITTHHQQVR